MIDGQTNVIRLVPMIHYHRFGNGRRFMKSPAAGEYLVGATTWPIVNGRMAVLKKQRGEQFDDEGWMNFEDGSSA